MTSAELRLLLYQLLSREKFDREMYFPKGKGNDILLQWSRTTLDGEPINNFGPNKVTVIPKLHLKFSPVIESEPNIVRLAGILYSTIDERLMCYFEDVATGKEVTIQSTEKDEDGNERQIEIRLEADLEREFVANLQLVAEAPFIKSLFPEEEQKLIDEHIQFFLSQHYPTHKL